jgi:hypothetical protein
MRMAPTWVTQVPSPMVVATEAVAAAESKAVSNSIVPIDLSWSCPF